MLWCDPEVVLIFFSASDFVGFCGEEDCIAGGFLVEVK